jgi:hypothetical protein
MTLQLLFSEFPKLLGEFYFIFYQCTLLFPSADTHTGPDLGQLGRSLWSLNFRLWVIPFDTMLIRAASLVISGPLGALLLQIKIHHQSEYSPLRMAETTEKPIVIRKGPKIINIWVCVCVSSDGSWGVEV